MSFSLPSTTSSLDTNGVAATATKLRAECDAAASPEQKGLLLHEIGVLEDFARNDGQAARDLLSAVNALPEFREPLERLVVLIERRKSYKNLGKLLDRLVKVAETPEESSRALVALAEYREDQETDLPGAKQALERATEVKGDDVDAWLSLEYIAAKLGDEPLRTRALAARADLATDPAWKALLLVDVARLRAAAGAIDEAIAAIERALEAKSSASFIALRELSALGLAADRADLTASSLEKQAALIERALSGGAPDDEVLEIPEERRTPAHVADLLLRAASLHRTRGDVDKAISLLDRAVALLPDDPAAISARMRAAEIAGDTTTAAALARAELDRGVEGSRAAALWMRVAEAAASNGDPAAALEALSKALEKDPGCIPARALELDILSGGGDPSALATALESAATALDSDALAVDFFLLAADTWARGAHDHNAAKAALSQATAAGGSPEIVARTSRMLAAVVGDGAWFEEATRRLLGASPPDDERRSLWFELGRSRLLRGDVPAATEAFTSLASAPGGTWLGHLLRAYAAPRRRGEGSSDARDAAALRELAQVAPDRTAATAFRAAAALRHQLGGLLDDAIADLSEAHDADPADVAVAVALATLFRRRGDSAKAATTLATCAAITDLAQVAAAFELEAGIVRWRAGDRAKAIEHFEAAAAQAPEAGAGLLAWALRGGQPNDVAARRKALEAAEPSESREALALERFALEAGRDGDRAAARAAVEHVTADGVLGVALDLASLLAPCIDADRRSAALDAIAKRSDEARALSRASAHAALLGSGPPPADVLEASAAEWAEADRSVSAALEWLAQALAARDVDGEIAARTELAQRVGGELGNAIAASGRIVARLAHGDVALAPLEGSDPGTVLANLELATPSCDPRRRAAALLDTAPLFEDGSAALAVALAGWNLLAAGDAAQAIRAFRRYVDVHREDIVGWEGLRAAAELVGDKALLAEASAALGDLSSDAAQGAELWERAATILLDELRDAPRGEAALSRAVARDISRFSAFDRLFRMVRARRDGAKLLELISARLEVADDPAELSKLYWERARVLRESGDSAAALEALDNVTMLEPDHVGALALTGEIYISEKRFADAAEKLARLAELSEAPTQQRLMSGIAAVDLYENRLGRVDRAKEVLLGLHRAGLATLPVRERLARAAAKTESWETATEILEELATQRETPEGRVEAARLAMVLYRDRMGDARRAEHAVEMLLGEAPDDGEALDLVLSGIFPRPLAGKLLQQGRAATLDTLGRAPLDLEKMARLAEIAHRLEDVQLRQVALGAVVALGDANPKVLAELQNLDGRVAHTPQIAVDDRVIASLRDPGDDGPVPELMAALAPTLAEVLGPGLTALGVSKKERVRPQDGLPVRNEVAAWAGALGLGEFEFYVGGRDEGGIFAVPTEVPAIVVGSGVGYPLSAVHRQALARELVALKLGFTILRHRAATDIAALVVAACNVAGVRVDSPQYALLAEFERQLGKELPRRVRKVLPDLAAPVADRGSDPLEWVRAANSTLDRMATIAIGDVSWVLAAASGVPRGRAPETTEAKARASRLLSFVLSPTFFAVREKLGMGVR
jgi:lipopolysaccharide biosynthesis regulator YciM